MKISAPKVLQSLVDRLKAEKDGALTHLRQDSREAIFFRIVLLVTLTVLCGVTAAEKLELVRCQHDPEDPQCVSTEAAGSQTTTEEKEKPDWAPAESKAAAKNTADALMKQSEQFQSWGVLVLTGIIAILITTKVHRTPGSQWCYVALGPAAVYLVVALNTASVFGMRYTFLLEDNDFSELSISTLSLLVQLQMELFRNAIICVSLFAGWFLLLIVMGKVQPFETPTER